MNTSNGRGPHCAPLSPLACTIRRQLEIAKRRKYSLVEIAAGAGLHHKTVERIAQNQYRRVDLGTLEGLLTFFHNEGMDIGIEDLFRMVPPEEG